MSGQEFQQCLDAAGLSQKQYSIMAEVSANTIGRRKINIANTTPEAALLVRLLAERPELVPLAWKLVGIPEGIAGSKRGRPAIRDESR